MEEDEEELEEPEPWHELRMCPFCGGDAIAVAPMVDENDNVTWHLVCEGHLVEWWPPDMPSEERLPVFLLPSIPEEFPRFPIYEPELVDRERLVGFYE